MRHAAHYKGSAPADCSYAADHAPHHHLHPVTDRPVCHVCHLPPGAPPVKRRARTPARVQLWTDGASSPDGRGGWAFILVAVTDDGEVVKRIEDCGGERDTTNNRMEMWAVCRGLMALTRPTTLTVYSDSKYVLDAFRQGWIASWDRRGWRKVKNVDLWRVLIEQAARHTITWEHVKGHAGHVLNEQCDQLAVEAKNALLDAPVAA